jgi:hypothetical protein
MDLVGLRALWEAHVSTTDKEVLDKVWQILCDSYGDIVAYACTNPETGLEDLLMYTDLVIEGWRLGRGRAKPPGRVAQQIVDVDLDDYERQCAETVSLYLAKKAASLPEVRRFRQERLGGKLLTTEEAEEFLRRELLRGVPDDLHSLSKDERSFFEYVDFMGLEELLEFVVPIDRAPRGLSQDLLFPYEGSDGFIMSRKTITENFSQFCLYLTAVFPWHPYDAARFLLTGERPEVVPLELSYHRRRQVFTLNFAPWISEKTFRKAYRKCQKVVQGGDNRRLKERTLAIMRFVTEHTDDEGRRPPWSQLTHLWNKKHSGEWRFEDRFGMRKAYLRAENELAGSRH